MVTGASSGGGLSSLCFSFQCLFKLFLHLYKLPHNEQANLTKDERVRVVYSESVELTGTDIIGIGHTAVFCGIDRDVVGTLSIGSGVGLLGGSRMR